MLLSAVSVLVVAQSCSEIPEGLMNNPVFCIQTSIYSLVSFYAVTFWISCLVCCLYNMKQYATLIQRIDTCNCLKLSILNYKLL